MVKVIFHTLLKELFLKEKICSPWERILSFKRSSHFEKGRICRESLLDRVAALLCALLFQRSGYAIDNHDDHDTKLCDRSFSDCSKSNPDFSKYSLI